MNLPDPDNAVNPAPASAGAGDCQNLALPDMVSGLDLGPGLGAEIQAATDAEATDEDAGLVAYSDTAVRTLFADHNPTLLRFVSKLLPGHADADNVASNTWRELISTWKRKGYLDRPVALLLWTARLRCTDWYRAHGEILVSLSDDAETLRDTAVHLWRTPSFTDEWIAAIDIRLALAKLPERQRQVLVLRYGMQMTLEETGALMTLTVSKVRYLQQLAVAALKKSPLLNGYRTDRSAGGAQS